MDPAEAAMGHAEVRERLAEALLAAGGLDALATDQSPEAMRVRDHLAACEACRAESDALATTGALLAAAAPDDLTAPPEARARLLRAVREMGVVRTPSPESAGGTIARPRWRWPPILAPLAASAMAIVIVGSLVLVADLRGQRDRAQAQLAALAEVASASGQLLGQPDHTLIALKAASGAAGGTVIFSQAAHRLVVWSRVLEPPDANERYDCYLERDGQRTLIGWMHLAGDVAYWAGDVPSGSSLGRAGDRFVVLSDQPGAVPSLTGTF